ncbi:MAG TPA: recombinase family protein [bacterium]|nr:recombinase family protein [bacterium]
MNHQGVTMRAAIYARVSTSDKDQDPMTQLLPLREFVAAQDWTVAGEHVDHASATDLRGRTAWREVLDLAAKRKIDVLLVWKLDRAFRSVSHATSTLEQLRRWGVGLRSYSEAWLDTSGSSPVGDLIFHVLAAVAQFERGLIAERVRAGMARAKKQGKRLGRPRAVNGEWVQIRPLVASGALSRREAARRLGCSARTVGRLVQQPEGGRFRQEPRTGHRE